MRMKLVPLLAIILLAAVPLWAQTVPTGTISGKVVDSDGLATPGVTVTAESPALQGSRTVTSSANGDYIIPFLPAGDYTVTFTLTGFKTVKQTARVSPSESVSVNPTMTVSTVSETITVVGQTNSEFGQSAEVATNFKSDLMDKLPTGRRFIDAANLTPGVQNTGPNGALSINGAMSFESLYVVNGVVVNENIRGTPNVLFIEDALQETTVSTAAISAEYGRFQGGVVQAITKSGGNEFSGSYRVTFDNNDWVALTPFPNDSRKDKMLYTQEATLGGPIVKDKLWFFGAGRMTGDRVTSNTTFTTNIPYDDTRNQKRYEGKLTWALNSNHTFKGAYTKIPDKEDGNFFGIIMDTASLVNRETPQDLLSANYTGILSPKFFLEGQYSRRRFTFIGSGSQFTDLIKGTLLIDQSRGNARYNSPTFCGVCDDERRDNQNITAKATYFASTSSMGSHNIVTGFDMFDDKRFANNHQSGSDFRVLTTGAIVTGQTLTPVLDNRTVIRWTPIFVGSEGNRFRTWSGFVNDTWTYNKHWTFNAGLRYDKNDGVDSMGNKVIKDAAFSPRLSATFDPKANGEWTINGAYAQYVAAIANGVGDAGSAGGQPATIDFDYLGPTVNTGNPANPVPVDQALNTLWNWFNSNGGTNRTPRGSPTIPGLTTRIDQSLKSPNSREITFGVTKRLGNRGSMRVDGIFRKFQDFYTTRTDLSTGQVKDQFGRSFDLGFAENTNDLKRKYKGMNLQVSYRAMERLNLGGNYTLGDLSGNVEGETGPNGPVRDAFLRFPEYFQRAWNYTEGNLNGDVRHKVRLWATYDVPMSEKAGSLNFGVLQFYNTGTPYGAQGIVDTRPYVTNPGYASPPAPPTFEPYYFTARDAYRMDDLWRTDLALNYAHKLGYKKSQLFVRGTIVNVFNRQGLTNYYGGVNSDLDIGCGTGGCLNTGVQTNSNNNSLARFNPFTTTPVEGVNWVKSATFGTPNSRYAYQTPRTYQFALGFRF